MTSWMGITWEIQQSAPTDTLKVAFTLMDLIDSHTRSLWLDPGMQTHANKIHKTLMYLKKKKKGWLYYLQWTAEESGYWMPISLTVRYLLGKANYQREAWWAWKQSKWSHNYTGSQHKMQEVLQLSTTGFATCQAGWMHASTWQVLAARPCFVGYHNTQIDCFSFSLF